MLDAKKHLKILNDVKTFTTKTDILPALIVENGSRAWGYDDANSDHDVKVLYLYKPERYQQFFLPPDNYTEKPSENREYQYWDIRKMLHLLYKGNAQVYELFYSPIIYYDSVMTKALRPKIDLMLAEKHVEIAYHYYGLACKTYRQKIAESGEKSSKRYLYVMRPLMHVNYMIDNNELPPLNFDDCLTYAETRLDSDVVSETREILDLKKAGRLNLAQEDYKKLDAYIVNELADLKSRIETIRFNGECVHTTEDAINDLYSMICHNNTD